MNSTIPPHWSLRWAISLSWVHPALGSLCSPFPLAHLAGSTSPPSAGDPRPGLHHVDFLATAKLPIPEEGLNRKEETEERRSSERWEILRIPPPEKGSGEWEFIRTTLEGWIQELLMNRIATHRVCCLLLLD